jgi:omega-6 fatty acid desaturase (delta-12 desaturase)
MLKQNFMEAGNRNSKDRSWEKVVMMYNHPDLLRSIWQICNSVLPFIFIWYLMYRSLDYSYLITLGLSLLASGFLIRIFIIFHDCGHRSFFSSPAANNITGIITGMLTFTPYLLWHRQHKIHHTTSGNLDKRGAGDIWTMTVEEYLESSSWKKFLYRAFRNPFIMLTVGPVYVILIQNRFSRKYMTTKEKWNLYFTNISIVMFAVVLSLMIGVKSFLLVQLPILFIAHSIGIWLFYIQHQFDDVEWDRQSSWDYKVSALNSSSFLKLPALFRWFTGNIGFHHVHHLSSRIPNYFLRKCHYENEIFAGVKPLSLSSTIRAFSLRLWDENSRKMISFRKLRQLMTPPKTAFSVK